MNVCFYIGKILTQITELASNILKQKRLIIVKMLRLK